LLVLVGCGNEQGYIGRERWLFYRPGIDYCAGPGFLASRQMKRRAESGSEWRAPPQPDPRQAVLQFHHQLAARGIRLILMPVPDKATIHPEKFSRRYEHWSGPPIHNSSYEQFIADVRQAGVLVCDVGNLLWEQKQRGGSPVFLATDTHWRPEALELAAAELARLLRQHVPLGEATSLSPGGSGVGGEGATARYHRRELPVSNLGDIAVMLRLPETQGIFAPEEIIVHPVVTADGREWQPDPNAEVLLLGDSFSNIYSHELMNWGKGAGLAEQLSFALQQPVDAIIQNDNGAHATRATLAEELAKGCDRLAGKKAVVWQFAVRELAVGDWKLLEMQVKAAPPSPCPTTPATPTEDQREELVVVGAVAAKSPAPRAGTVTYADHIFTIDLVVEEVLSGQLAEKRVPVYLFSMRQQKNTPAFSWAIGQRVKLRLQPWEPEWKKKYGQLNRTRTEDFDLLESKHWWGEAIE
jgi:alginate O-acetyltransferase complex protein AlgJ